MAQSESYNFRLMLLRVKATLFYATGTAALQTSLIVEPFTASGAEVLATSTALSIVRPGVSPHAVGTHMQVSVRHLCARSVFMARLIA